MVVRLASFAIPTAAAVIQYAAMRPLMPDQLASHFDAAGNPDGYSDPASFFTLTLLMVIGLGGVFNGLVPMLVSMLPSNMVNLPNRDYWLAAERKDASIEHLGRYMAIFWLVNGLLMVGLIQLALVAAMQPVPHLANGAFLGGLVLIFAFTIGWILMLWKDFNEVPKPA